METRANYVIVGIFTLLSVLAAFAFVYWTAAIGDRGETTALRVRIPGSASGLGRGSAVLFNGVKVGDVKRVYIDVTNPSAAIADTEIDRLTPISKSTQASIGIAGLTGQANIEIKGADLKEPSLLDEAEANGTVAEITADPSAVTNLLETAQDIFKRTDAVLDQLEGFTKDVREPLTQTVRNTEKFSEALSANSEGVGKFLESVSKLSDQLAGASDKLDSTLQAAENILKAVDPAKVSDVVDNVQKFTTQLSATGDQLGAAAKDVQDFTREVREPLTQTVQNAQKFSETLSANSEEVGKLLQNASKLSETLVGTSDKLDTTLQSAQNILKSVDPDKVSTVVNNVEEFTTQLSTTGRQLDGIARQVQDTVGNIDELAKNAQATLGKANGVIEGVDPAKVRTILANIEQASRSANAAAADISRVTERVGRHTDDIDRIVGDASQIAQRLNAASTRVDGILAKVDKLLGSDETNGLMANANATLKSIKQVADTLNGRIGTIADGLAQFSTQGLRDVEALVRDTRRSVNRIESAVDDFQRNPQRIITGGEGTVREYDGRTRR